MKIKLGVSLSNLKLQMRPPMKIMDKIFKDYGKEAVITSGTEYTSFEALTEENSLIHSASSLHTFGYALDFRTRNIEIEVDKVRIAHRLRTELNKISEHYRVILEPTHIHVEWRGLSCF